MKIKVFAIVILVLLAGMAATAHAIKEGTVREYDGGGRGKVTFSIDIHMEKVEGATCLTCHPGIWTQKMPFKVTPKEHTSGKLCFFCHNNVKAPNTCSTCHKK